MPFSSVLGLGKSEVKRLSTKRIIEVNKNGFRCCSVHSFIRSSIHRLRFFHSAKY